VFEHDVSHAPEHNISRMLSKPFIQAAKIGNIHDNIGGRQTVFIRPLLRSGYRLGSVAIGEPPCQPVPVYFRGILAALFLRYACGIGSRRKRGCGAYIWANFSRSLSLIAASSFSRCSGVIDSNSFRRASSFALATFSRSLISAARLFNSLDNSSGLSAK
jgi:hypothetical protein